MSEITFIVDSSSGSILVEDNQDLSADAFALLRGNLGEGREIACARPLEIIAPPVVVPEDEPDDVTVRIAGYYHNCLTEGPGRRSSVLFQFCPLKCRGCYVPELHSKTGGAVVPVKKLAELLLDPEFERDGVTILGGEPFAQSKELLALVRELRLGNCPHIVCYSGYTFEALLDKAKGDPATGEILREIDILIDGPFVEALASTAGAWTGSGNQRVIDFKSLARGQAQ